MKRSLNFSSLECARSGPTNSCRKNDHSYKYCFQPEANICFPLSHFLPVSSSNYMMETTRKVRQSRQWHCLKAILAAKSNCLSFHFPTFLLFWPGEIFIFQFNANDITNARQQLLPFSYNCCHKVSSLLWHPWVFRKPTPFNVRYVSLLLICGLQVLSLY